MDERTRNGLERIYDFLADEIGVIKEDFLAEFEKCEVIYAKDTSTGWESLLYSKEHDSYVRVSETGEKVKVELFSHEDEDIEV